MVALQPRPAEKKSFRQNKNQSDRCAGFADFDCGTYSTDATLPLDVRKGSAFPAIHKYYFLRLRFRFEA
jgi:hypothetical protein